MLWYTAAMTDDHTLAKSPWLLQGMIMLPGSQGFTETICDQWWELLTNQKITTTSFVPSRRLAYFSPKKCHSLPGWDGKARKSSR